MAVMAYCVLHGFAPRYLSQLARVADLPSRRGLRSSSTHQLHVPPFRLSTVSRRSFSVAAAILWNTLPVDVQSSPSLPVFCQRLKTFLFHKSFPDVVWQADYAFVDLVMATATIATLKISWLIDSPAPNYTAWRGGPYVTAACLEWQHRSEIAGRWSHTDFPIVRKHNAVELCAENYNSGIHQQLIINTSANITVILHLFNSDAVIWCRYNMVVNYHNQR